MKLNKKQAQAKEDCLKKLKECQDDGDTEISHINADDALTDLLEALGMVDIVEAYHGVFKWFA